MTALNIASCFILHTTIVIFLKIINLLFIKELCVKKIAGIIAYLRYFCKQKRMRILVLFLVFSSCSGVDQNEYEAYGETIAATDAIQVDSFLAQVNETSQSYKVEGTIEEVCQMKGCWMTLKNESGATIRVTFKDYGFFVPKDIHGKKVIIAGQALSELLDEDDAKHYADDAGKVYDPSMRNSISFVAHGVLVQKS